MHDGQPEASRKQTKEPPGKAFQAVGRESLECACGEGEQRCEAGYTVRARTRLGSEVPVKLELSEQRGDTNGLHCYCFTDNFLLPYIINEHRFGKESFCQIHHAP